MELEGDVQGVPPIPREGTFKPGNPFFRKGTHAAEMPGFQHVHSTPGDFPKSRNLKP
jgi:hypothetical protein